MELFERKEFKYAVPIEMIQPLRDRLMVHVNYDPFCLGREDSLYSVRSIYLDTTDLLFYYEKIDGQNVRKKLRIRTYDTGPNQSNNAFLEIKRKVDDTVYKERVMINLNEAYKLGNGAQIGIPQEKPSFATKTALNRFIYLTKRLILEPKALITYEREAFHGKEDPGIRITFDLNVRSYINPDYDEIFREDDMRSVADPVFVLEVKFTGDMPIWMRQVIRDFGLRQQSFSKYCNGLDIWSDMSKKMDNA
jgi:SPX domain protein involved in polyphosphate accumulation